MPQKKEIKLKKYNTLSQETDIKTDSNMKSPNQIRNQANLYVVLIAIILFKCCIYTLDHQFISQ